MSHFTVLIIGETDIEKALYPFWELDLNKQDLIKDDRAEFIIEFKKEDLEKEFEKFKEEHKEDIKKGKEDYWIKYRTCSAEEWVRDWDGHYLNKEETDYGYYTNPNAKWDWYEIGGRWAGSLKLKKNVDKSKYIDPNFSWGWNKESKKEVLLKGFVDSALKKDVDFSRDEEAYKNAARFWELKVEEQEPKNEEEKEQLKFDWYKKEYYTKKYKDKKTYATLTSEFGTHAVLINGEWFEKGNMGWFGCHSATPEEEREWDISFFDKFISKLPGDTLLTIVDCHI